MQQHRLACLLTLLMLSGATTVHAKPLLRDGDRVLFVGDNATLQFYYARMVENYFTLRYPEWRIRYFNTGWTDTAAGRRDRIERDIRSFRPTVATICYGMNDGGFAPTDLRVRNEFRRGLAGLIERFKMRGVRVIVMSSNPVEPANDSSGRISKENWTYNHTLELLATDTVRIAKEKRVPVFDAFTAMRDITERARREDPKFSLMQDAVYPNPLGHTVMGYGLLKAMGAGEPAASLEIDAAKSLVKADRTKVEDVKISNSEITFTRTDAALPTGFFPDPTPLLKYVPIVEELNQYPFKVTGLKAPFWTVTVEGIAVGRFSNEELAAGVNLATRPGPWQVLAKTVDSLVSAEQGWVCQRWVYISQYVPPAPLQASYDRYLKKVDDHFDMFQLKRMHAVDNRTWKWVLSADP